MPLKKLLSGGVAFAMLFYTFGANAHTSEQGFVLLLPTNVYISAGVLAVILTVLILAVVPSRLSGSVLAHKVLFHLPNMPSIHVLTSLASFACLVFLLVIGITGPHDPLKNLLPLFIWTIWWIGLICLQGLMGNLWYGLNPWTGIYSLLSRLKYYRNPPLKIPERVGVWPAVVIYIVFSCFALADPAPEDPPRLALVVSVYWIFTMIGMFLFGANAWLQRCECFTVLLNRLAQLSAFSTKNKKVSIGLPGWQLFQSPITSYSAAFFVLTLLAIGSFDGLNETFYWLHIIGVNPLEFPGRSAVIVQTVSGLLLSITLLFVCFAFCVWSGVQLGNRYGNLSANDKTSFSQSFIRLSASMLPIALAYHFAHFLTAFLVNAQYTLAAISDPLQEGRDLLKIGKFYVTTGFFNTQSTVKMIWLTQASAVVIGHVLSVILAHSIAIRLWGDSRRAVLSQLPLAMFMVLYTLLGLWLLAAPRGA